jgi:ABC-type nitrate/sulfonate/bicarbonate transport system substrate-binding protein
MPRHLRNLLVSLAVLTGVLGSSAVAGASTNSTATGALRTVRISLDWTANVDFLGIYDAINLGYFTEEGIKPVIVPYSGTAGETLLSADKADIAFTYPPNIPAYRASGLQYRAVAGLTQENTIDLAVLRSSPYTSPAQLSGKLYGGFGIPSDPPIIKTIFSNLGVKHPSLKQVVLNGTAYQALAAKRVAYTSMFGGIDDVTAELQGAKLRLFPIRKYLGSAASYPDDSLAATDQLIHSDPALLQHTLAALAKGYIYAAHNPSKAAAILIKDNPTALAHSHNIVYATAKATAPTFLTADGTWGSLSDRQFSGITKIMQSGGLFKGETPPPASDDFTNSLLPQG